MRGSVGALVLVFALACSGGSDPQPAPVVAIPLVDRFAPEQIDGRRAPVELARSEWRFAALASGLAWNPGPGVAGLEVRDGRLVGTASSAAPVVELTAAQPLGGGDTLH